MKKHSALNLTALILPAALGTLHAAPITWSPGNQDGFIDADGHTRFSANGSFVRAVNLGGPDLVVDTGAGTISFIGDESFLPDGSFGVTSVDSTEMNWVTVLQRADWSNPSPAPLVIDNLVNGVTYEIELFVWDARNDTIGNRTQVYSDMESGGNESEPVSNNQGQSVIGTFTAVGSTQSIFLSQSASDPTLNAFILREIAIEDTDNDNLPDGYELGIEGVTSLDDLDGTIMNPIAMGSGSGDFDGDGLNDFLEFENNANPTLTDTDGDLIGDFEEVSGTSGFVTEPDDDDTDDDGILDAAEQDTADGFATDPTKPDTDDDGIFDLYEQENNAIAPGLDPTNTNDAVLDLDQDGLSNLAEFDPSRGPNPASPQTRADNADTDDDGYDDLVENNTNIWVSSASTGSDPTDDDTDDDTLLDGMENLEIGTNNASPYKSDPNLADSDGDGLNDNAEITAMTFLDDTDSDDDNFSDSEEVTAGSDPLSPSSTPITVNGFITIANDNVEGSGDTTNTQTAVPWTGINRFNAPYGGFIPLAGDEDEGIGSDGDQLPLEALNGSVPFFNQGATPSVTYNGTLAPGIYTARIQVVNFNNSGFPEFDPITLAGVLPATSLTPAPESGDDEVWTVTFEIENDNPSIGQPLTLIVPSNSNAVGNAGIDHVFLTYSTGVDPNARVVLTGIDVSDLANRRVTIQWTPIAGIELYTVEASLSMKTEEWAGLNDGLSSQQNPTSFEVTLDEASFPIIPSSIFFRVKPSED